MKMCFENPANGYVETTRLQWLWALLFGPLYFFSMRMYSTAIVCFALAIMTMGLTNIVYAYLADRMVYEHYLRNGWRQVKCL